MKGYGVTRNDARLALVESSALKPCDLLWMPDDKLAYATRSARFGLDFWGPIFSGRSRKEKARLSLRVLGTFAMQWIAILSLEVLGFWLNSRYGIVVAAACLLFAAVLLMLAMVPLWRSIMDPL